MFEFPHFYVPGEIETLASRVNFIFALLAQNSISSDGRRTVWTSEKMDSANLEIKMSLGAIRLSDRYRRLPPSSAGTRAAERKALYQSERGKKLCNTSCGKLCTWLCASFDIEQFFGSKITSFLHMHGTRKSFFCFRAFRALKESDLETACQSWLHAQDANLP